MRNWSIVAGIGIGLAVVFFSWRPWRPGPAAPGRSGPAPTAGPSPEGRPAAGPDAPASGSYDDWRPAATWGPLATGLGPSAALGDPIPDPVPDPGPEPIEGVRAAIEGAVGAGRADEALALARRLLDEGADEDLRRLAADRPLLVRRARYAGTAGAGSVLAVGDAGLEALEAAVAAFLATGEPAAADRAASVAGVTAALVEAVAAAGPLHPEAAPGVVRLDLVDDRGGRPGACFVAVPIDYDPTRRWPVLVYLHGDEATADLVGGLAGGLHRRHPGHLIVAPHADGRLGWGPSPDGLSRIETALDRVAARFAIDPDRVAVTGFSMGGLGAWDLALRDPGRLAGILPQAGTALDPTRQGLLANLDGLDVRFLHGGADRLVDAAGARAMDRALTAAGVAHEYVEFESAGHLGFPPSAVATAYDALLAARRTPWPRRVRLAVVEPERDRKAWLQVVEIDPAVPRQAVVHRDRSGEEIGRGQTLAAEVSVVARVEEGRFVVRAVGVRRLALLLHPGLVDLAGPIVVVTPDGGILHQGRVRPDPRLALETARRDRGRVAHARIEFRIPD